jgi:hypothetical protein
MLGQNSNKNKKSHYKSIVLDKREHNIIPLDIINFPPLSDSKQNNLEESKIDNSNSWVNITKLNINDKNEIIKNTTKKHIINKSEKNQKLENEVKQILEIKDSGLDFTELNSPKDQEIIDSGLPIVNKKKINKHKNEEDNEGFIKVGSNNNSNKLKKIYDKYIENKKKKKEKIKALQEDINRIINNNKL